MLETNGCSYRKQSQPMQFLDDSHGCAGWSGEMAERIRAFKPANKTQEEELARALSLMSPSGE